MSDTVVGGVGPVGRRPAKPGSPEGNFGDVDSLLLKRCRGEETPREVPEAERPRAETLGETVEESWTPREDCPQSRVCGRGQRKKHRQGCAF